MQKVSPQQSSLKKPICDTTLVFRLSREAFLELLGCSPSAEHTPWLHLLSDVTDTSRPHLEMRFPLGIFPTTWLAPCAMCRTAVQSAPALVSLVVSLTGSERDRTAVIRTGKRNVKNMNTDVQGHTTHHFQFVVSTAHDQKQISKTESLTGSFQSLHLETWTKPQK